MITDSTDAALPADVVRLVIAARNAAYDHDAPNSSHMTELDDAAEAFASRVPWEDAPEEIA